MGNLYSITEGMKRVDVPENDARNNLPVGTVLYFNGYGNDSYVIIKNLGINENFPEYGANYDTVNLRTGESMRQQSLGLKPLSQKIDNSIAVYITEEVKTPDEVLDAIELRDQAKVLAAKEKEMKETARAEYIEKIKKDYPYLTMVEESKKSGTATGAANLKKQLQRAFPGKKVSVKSQVYSMGCSINASVEGVEWGSKEAELANSIGKRYQEGSFDGMTDCYDYADNPFSDVFGGAKYVFVN